MPEKTIKRRLQDCDAALASDDVGSCWFGHLVTASRFFISADRSCKTDGGNVNIACLHRSVSAGETFQKYSYVSAASRSRLRWIASSSAIGLTMALFAISV